MTVEIKATHALRSRVRGIAVDWARYKSTSCIVLPYKILFSTFESKKNHEITIKIQHYLEDQPVSTCYRDERYML